MALRPDPSELPSELPSAMNALFLTKDNRRHFNVLAGAVPVPPTAKDALLVEVKAAAVSARDIAVCRSFRALPGKRHALRAPVPGCALAGVVVQAPPQSHFKPGQSVAALTRFGGGFGTYAALKPSECWTTNLSFADAAATAGAASAAFHAVRAAGVSAGDTVAVAGVLTAPGALIAQTCRLVYGARVVAGVHGAAQLRAASKYADIVVDRSSEKVTSKIGNLRIDAAFDVEGRLEQLCRIVKKNGTVVRVISAAERVCEKEARRVRHKCRVKNITLRRIEGCIDSKAVESTKSLLRTLQLCAPSGPAFGIKQWGPALQTAEQGVDVGAVLLLH
ncbi:quinone reductase [Gracilaria domingensis]|nr:quinone reductase [Gracilaria domingensis]